MLLLCPKPFQNFQLYQSKTKFLIVETSPFLTLLPSQPLRYLPSPSLPPLPTSPLQPHSVNNPLLLKDFVSVVSCALNALSRTFPIFSNCNPIPIKQYLPSLPFLSQPLATTTLLSNSVFDHSRNHTKFVLL